uniref:Uncharacterized protein n=1 Tax=Setaria digitata TaxID=48799 RepID=A0A915PPS0_9BILA
MLTQTRDKKEANYRSVHYHSTLVAKPIAMIGRGGYFLFWASGLDRSKALSAPPTSVTYRRYGASAWRKGCWSIIVPKASEKEIGGEGDDGRFGCSTGRKLTQMDSKSDVQQPTSANSVPALQASASAAPRPVATTNSATAKDPQPNIDLSNFSFGAFQLSAANANVNNTSNMVPITQRNIFYDANSNSIQMHKQQIAHQTGMNLNSNAFHAATPSHSSAATAAIKEEPTALNSSCFSCSSLRLPTCHTAAAFGQPAPSKKRETDNGDFLKGAIILR